MTGSPINTAPAILLGSRVAQRVYQGAAQVWPFGTPTEPEPEPPSSAATLHVGASTDASGFSTREDKWAAMESDLRAAGGFTDQVMSIRHTFNGHNVPTSWASSPANADIGLGCTASLLNTGADQWTWRFVENEANAWWAAGRPVVSDATTYPYQHKLQNYVRSSRDGMPAGHLQFLTYVHEPGWVQGHPQSEVGTGEPNYTIASRLAWNTGQAYFSEIVLREANGRVRPTSIVQGADVRGYNWPDGTKRSLDHYDYGTYLTAAQRAGCNYAVDVYQVYPGDGPGPILASLDTWRTGRGYGYAGLGETTAPPQRNSDGTLAAGESLGAARVLGDPTRAGGYRTFLEGRAGWEFVCYFESGVITEGITTSNPGYMRPYPKMLGAWAQFARRTPFGVDHLANQ